MGDMQEMMEDGMLCSECGMLIDADDEDAEEHSGFRKCGGCNRPKQSKRYDD